MSILGELVAIWRYPVKSLAPQALTEVHVQADGLPGDRTAALVIEDGHARIGKPYRGKENNFLHLTDSTPRAVELARERNVRVRVEQEDGRYFDLAPVSIVFDAWLNEASALVGYELEPLRFRPNFFVRASAGFSDKERDLTGAILQIGEARFKVRKPIERCVTPTYDLQTGKSDPAVLRAVAQHRETLLGVYCDVLEPGLVRTNDAVIRH